MLADHSTCIRRAMECILTDTRVDLQDIIAELRKATTTCSVLKETRPYSMTPEPVLVWYSQQLVPRLRISLIVGHRIHVPKPSDVEISVVNRFIVEPFLQFFVRANQPHLTLDELVIPVKVSKKTILPGKVQLRDAVRTLLGVARDLSVGAVPNLQTFAQAAGELDVYNHAVDDDSWLAHLVDVVAHSVTMTADDYTSMLLQEHERVNLAPLAEMSKKIYLARGQIRTYNVCRSPLLNLCGDILQQIYQPRNQSHRAQTALASLCPVRGKNLLDLSVPIHDKTNFCVAVVGDLSAFTATSQAVWVMLLAAYHTLGSRYDHEMDKVRLARVGDCHISFTLRQVLRIYLNRTALVKVVYEQQIVKILGGILGLKANMTLTMTAMAATFELFRKTDPSVRGVSIHFQIGGDDFFMLTLGDTQRCLNCVAAFKDRVTSHVGFLGEWTQQVIPVDGAIHTFPARYCKKLFTLQAMDTPKGRRLRISSKDKMPLMLEHFVVTEEYNERVEHEFLIGVGSACKKFSESNRILAYSVLPAVADVIFGYQVPRSVTERIPDRDMLSTGLVGHGKVMISRQAFALVERVPDNKYSDATFRSTFTSKLTHLVEQTPSRIECIVNKGDKVVAYTLDREKGHYTKPRELVLEPTSQSEDITRTIRLFLETVEAIRNMYDDLEEERDRVITIPSVNLLI